MWSDRNRVKFLEGTLTGLVGILLWSFEGRFFSTVILPVFEALFDSFFDLRDAGMFGKGKRGKDKLFPLSNERGLMRSSMSGAL